MYQEYNILLYVYILYVYIYYILYYLFVCVQQVAVDIDQVVKNVVELRRLLLCMQLPTIAIYYLLCSTITEVEDIGVLRFARLGLAIMQSCMQLRLVLVCYLSASYLLLPTSYQFLQSDYTRSLQQRSSFQFYARQIAMLAQKLRFRSLPPRSKICPRLKV